MWSYKNETGEIYSGLSTEEVREHIQLTKIQPCTLLKSLHFPEWTLASETLFFNTSSTQLPSKAEEKSLQIDFTQSTLPTSRSPRQSTPQLLFALNLLLALIPLFFLVFKTIEQQQALSEKEFQLELHQSILQDRAKAEIKLAETDEALFISKIYLEHSPYDKEQRNAISLPLQENLIFWSNEVQRLAHVEQNSDLPSLIEQQKNQFTHLRKSSWIYFISFLIPFSFGIKDHFSATKLVASKPLSFFLALLHSIPGLHLLLYTVISAMWNLDSTQRKNNLILTLPISLTAFFCLSLSVYLFFTATHFALISFFFSCVLWLILHCRQLQMLSYATINSKSESPPGPLSKPPLLKL